jgi:tetratricopeptide (TPR) repeat protein
MKGDLPINQELENTAKKKELEHKYAEAANLYLKAAYSYMQLDKEKNYIWNLANYFYRIGDDYYTKGKKFSIPEEFCEASKYFKEAEKAFKEIEIEDTAFFCGYKSVISSFAGGEDLNEVIKKAENFLDSYKSLCEKGKYKRFCARIETDILKWKSTKYRFEGNTELAEEYAKKAYEKADFYKEHLKDPDFEIKIIYNKQIYYSLKAKRLEEIGKLEEAAELYKLSAEIIREINEKIANHKYSDYYKCLALSSLNGNHTENFKSNINKAIEHARKCDDEKQIFFCLILKKQYLKG